MAPLLAWKNPTAQFMHALNPDVAEYKPGMQMEHDEEPVVVGNKDASQTMSVGTTAPPQYPPANSVKYLAP